MMSLILFECCFFLTSWLWCNPPFSLSVRKDLMTLPLGILTPYVWVQCIMDKADTVKENIICGPKEHKGLDMACDTHWGTDKMLNIRVSYSWGEEVEYIFVVGTEVERLLPSLCWGKVTMPFIPCLITPAQGVQLFVPRINSDKVSAWSHTWE